MLRNLSYNDPELYREIDELVGPAYSFFERITLKGIGSPRLTIGKASEKITELLTRDHNLNFCNIELRPNGIIFRFRSKLETYGLIIPFRQLTIFKGKPGEMALYGGEHFIAIDLSKGKGVIEFLNKLMAKRLEQVAELGGPNPA